MPLCPQITNTPITVTYNSTDYTLDSVQDVQTTATTFYAAPTPNAQAVGDIWYDTSNGNKQYRWDGSSWVLVQDTAIPAATTAASTAQSTASSAAAAAAAAQADATTAIANATTAIANAATANATATTAAYNAGVAQSTANGKNTTHYSTGSPSGGGTNGDIWFTVNGGGTVLYQYVYNSGSWVSAPISNTVIANLDAGKINAGTITGIAYNNGSGTFSVSPSGVLVASSATITGTVYASAGTFTGTVTATSGSFTGTVTATSGSFTGDLYSSNGTIGGFSINSGYLSYGSTYLNASSGSSAGTYCIYDSSRGIYLGGTMKANAIDLGSYGWTSSGTITAGIGNFSGALGAASASITGTVSANLLSTGSGSYYLNNSGTLNAATSYITTANDTNLNISNTVSIGGGYGVTSSWSPNSDNTYNLGISGSLRWSHVYANNTTITTSDARLKTNIKASPLGLTFIEALNPVSYQWIEGSKKIVLDDQNQAIIIGEDASGKPIYKTESIPGTRIHYGLIAQEVKKVLDDANVGDFAGWVQDDINNPDSTQSLSYEQFISPLIKAVQELSNRLSKLEGKQ